MINSLADVAALERTPLEQHNDVWTVHDLIRRGAERDLDKVALHYLPSGSLDELPETITYRQLLASLHRAANLFASLGIGASDNVAILLPNVPQNYAAMLGAAVAGIAFPINWMLNGEQTAELINAARSKVIVALGPTPGYDIWEKVDALRARLAHRPRVIQVLGPDGRTDPEIDFDRMSRAQSDAAVASGRQAAPDDTAFYIHTGGTTRAPKIAQITHRAIAYKCWAVSVMRGQDASQVVYAASPLFHVGGIVLRTINTLSQGQTSIIPGALGFRTKNVLRDYWKLVERFRITDLSGVPTVLGALTSVPINADVSSLRPFASTGSSPLPSETALYFEKTLGIRISLDYGMTETTASVTLPIRDAVGKDASSGIRIPFTEIRTVLFDSADRIGRDCAADEIGEIIIRSPGVTPGYLDASLNAALFIGHGWVRSGDLGRLDADGFLWVTGRAKDVIIRGGHNIDPRVIEETLMTHACVASAAAVGKPDAYAGELPVAYVQLKPGMQADAGALKDFARAHIPERAAAPVDVFIIDAIPVTGVGKIFKPALRDRALHSAVSTLLATMVPGNKAADIEVRPHPVHGTHVTVTLLSAIGADATLEDRLHTELGRFSFSHSIVWREGVQR